MERTRLDYVDTLKFLAVLVIIFLHVSAIWPNAEILHINLRSTSQMFRWGVPMFIMISGVLLLNREMDLLTFFKKRFVRVFYPFIFFALINYIVGDVPSFLTLYWYCWMIIGAYLAIPIINRFILSCKDEELKYYVIIFLFASFIFQVFYTFDIRFALDINFFITPVSYLILGYYLSQREFDNPNRVIAVAILVFIITSVIKYHTGSFINNYSDEIFSTRLDLGIVQVLHASSVFLIVKEIYSSKVSGLTLRVNGFLRNDTVKKFILSVSNASYGMYLIQFLYRDYAWGFVGNLALTGTQVLLCYVSLSILIFFVSWVSIYVLGKIPFIKKFSGYA